MPGITEKDLANYKDGNYVGMLKGALQYADGAILAAEKINPEVLEYLKTLNIPVLSMQSDETYIDAYNEFYDKILEGKRS